MGGDSMIQVITNTGRKLRFTKEVIPIKDFNPETDIAYQKELTDEEIHMIPEVKNGKMIMRNKNPEELAREQSARDLRIEQKNIEDKLQAGIRSDAMEKHLTTAEKNKLSGI